MNSEKKKNELDRSNNYCELNLISFIVNKTIFLSLTYDFR